MEQYRLYRFTQLLKKVIKSLATNKLPEKNLKDEVKQYFFAKEDFLNDKENLSIFPEATKNFKKILEDNNGHTLDTIKNNLHGWLDKEINTYFQAAHEYKILVGDTDTPTSFSLSQKSPYVFISIFFIALIFTLINLFLLKK